MLVTPVTTGRRLAVPKICGDERCSKTRDRSRSRRRSRFAALSSARREAGNKWSSRSRQSPTCCGCVPTSSRASFPSRIDDRRAEVVGDLLAAGPDRRAPAAARSWPAPRARRPRRSRAAGVAPRICACLRKTSGVSCSGSNESEISRMSLRALGKRADALGQLGELSIHQRAEIRKWTSCINKRKYNHVAAQIGELERLCRPGWSW